VGPQSFRYGRSFFFLRALLLLVLFSFALAFLGIQTVTPGPWVALIAVLFVLHLAVVGLSPVLTNHELLRSRVILRQGWYFKAIIPLDHAESIGPWDGEAKYGLRLSLGRRTLFVVGSGQNLVSIRLRAPRRFSQVLFLQAREIVFDVDDRDRFLAAVEERVTAERLPARKIAVLPAAGR